VKWVEKVRKAIPAQWEQRVVLALLVLPVFLVLLALLVQSDPRVRQVLAGWLVWLVRLVHLD
jgi:type IV secretory pathway VirB3-like protein